MWFAPQIQEQESGLVQHELKSNKLLAAVREDAALRQLVEGKMEASVYEDVLRTLLGSNAYSLFTLHKIISQMLKQLQIILVEAASQPLLDLYAYERAHTALGAMSDLATKAGLADVQARLSTEARAQVCERTSAPHMACD